MLGRNSLKILTRNFYSSIKETNGNNEKIYLKINDEFKSYWQDIPLMNADNSLNMVIEIPALSRTILEMNKNEKFNPLMTKPPKPSKQTNNPTRIRDYSKDPMINYGFLPQTYSSKEKKYRNNYNGDGDPLDVIEIGGPFNLNAGDIIQIKLLGSFCLIDEGEIDWKIVVANINSHVNGNTLDSINEIMHWFKIFKTFYGKKENVILDNNKFFSIKETKEIIAESHMDYNNFILNKKL